MGHPRRGHVRGVAANPSYFQTRAVGFAQKTSLIWVMDPVSRFFHPLEQEAVEVATAHLRRLRWPFERIPVDFTFGLRTAASHSQFKEPVIRGGLLTARVSIFFNYLFVIQNERAFIEEVVPHELAHVFAQAEALRSSRTIKDHGNEWKGWLLTISSRATPRSNMESLFDDRAFRLFKGGAAFRCKCPGDAGFHVVAAESAEKFAAASCKRCEAVYQPTEAETAPSQVLTYLDYVTSESKRRLSA